MRTKIKDKKFMATSITLEDRHFQVLREKGIFNLSAFIRKKIDEEFFNPNYIEKKIKWLREELEFYENRLQKLLKEKEEKERITPEMREFFVEMLNKLKEKPTLIEEKFLITKYKEFVEKFGNIDFDTFKIKYFKVKWDEQEHQ